MMPPGTRTNRHAILAAKVLVVVLLAVSPRALLSPTTSYTKAVDSKRPKAPKNMVRAEAFQISALEKQSGESTPSHPASPAAGFPRTALIRALPQQAFTQLTKPDYLNPSGSGGPPPPFAPPV